MGVRFGEKGATPAEKGARQRAEGHRSTKGVDGTLPGDGGTWQTKITKPPSKVKRSCPAAPLLQEIHKDIAVMRALDDHIEEPVEAEEAWAAAEDTSPQYPNGFYVFTLVG